MFTDSLREERRIGTLEKPNLENFRGRLKYFQRVVPGLVGGSYEKVYIP